MPKKRVAIELTSPILFGGRMRLPGAVIDCSHTEAKGLLHRNKGKLSTIEIANTDEKPLPDHSVAELREIADEYEIDGAQDMKKGDLIAAIEAAESGDEGK